jgi:GT2 family glycosyltransferase
MNDISKIKISIVMVHMVGRDYLLNCLESIYKSDHSNFEIIVVFNGNFENNYELIGEKFPKVRRFLNSKNFGFPAANNRGIKKATGEFIFWLNDDTLIHPKLLTILATELLDKQVGLVGSKMFYMDEPEKIWFAGGKIDWRRQEIIHLGRNFLEKDWPDEKKEVDCVTGCALMTRRDVIDKVGLLDEAYFAYFEDTDWNLKVKQAGYKLIYVPFGGVWHAKSFTTGQMFWGKEKSRSIFWLLPEYFRRYFMKEYRRFRNKYVFFNRYIPREYKNIFYAKTLFIEFPMFVWAVIYKIPKSLIYFVRKFFQKGRLVS